MVGKRIYELRTELGLSLTELAERAGVAKSYLSNIERQLQTNPSIAFLEKICVVLEIEPSILLSNDAEWREKVKSSSFYNHSASVKVGQD